MVNDHCSRSEVDTLCGSRGVALQAGTVCVSFTLIYCNKSLEQGPREQSAVQRVGSRRLVAKSRRSGVRSPRAGTHPEHEGQGQGCGLDLGLREPLLVCTRGSGSDSWDEKEAITGVCFLLWFQAVLSLSDQKSPSNSQPPSPKNKISFSFW